MAGDDINIAFAELGDPRVATALTISASVAQVGEFSRLAGSKSMPTDTKNNSSSRGSESV